MYEVTVAIPVYNTEDYLAKTIESCLKQTFSNIEIIIINDGSTDNSLNIANSYKESYGNIKVITTENRGLSEARNRGLFEAQGKYIYFLDSDDTIKSNTIKECYDLSEKNDLEILFFDSDVIGEKAYRNFSEYKKDAYRKELAISQGVIYSGKRFLEEYSQNDLIPLQVWLAFIKKDFLVNNQIKFLPNAIYEDVAFNYHILSLAKRIMYIAKAFHVRLYRAESIMTTPLTIRKVFSVYEIILEMARVNQTCNLEDDIYLDYLLKRARNLSHLVLRYINKKERQELAKYKDELIKLQNRCINEFISYLKNDGTSINNIRLVLDFIEVTSISLERFDERILNIIKNIGFIKDEKTYKKLKGLPLSGKGTIGVYGSGNHAKAILEKYEEMVGRINSNIVFIDTYKESYNERFLGSDIININDIAKVNIKEIIIISYFYEKEIYENLIKKYKDKFIIHRLYNESKLPLDTNYIGKTYNKWERYIKSKVEPKKIILINTPEHTNIGDHLIAEAAKSYLAKYLPNYETLEVTNVRYRENRTEIIENINMNDIILITGGGFFGSLWPYSGENIYSIIQNLPNNKIIILPQSMFFEENKKGFEQKRLTFNLLEKHRDLTICFREKVSIERFKDYFGEIIIPHLMPDMALLENYSEVQCKREGIMLCLRTDRESCLDNKNRKDIEEFFNNSGYSIIHSSMHWKDNISISDRKAVISGKIREIKKAKLVITDTLHCLISCAISGIPCIAINNVTYKVKGVYDAWLKDIRYIKYVDNLDEIFNIDLDSWDELNKRNYYEASYEEYKIELKGLILD